MEEEEPIKMMTARERATSFVKAVAENAVHLAKGGKILARPEIRVDRLAHCLEPCEHFQPETDRCKVCWCKVETKTAILRSECPVGKW